MLFEPMTLPATIGDAEFGGKPTVSIEQSTTCALLTLRIPWMKLLGKVKYTDSCFVRIMSKGTSSQKNRIAKIKVVDRFYIEAFTSEYAPSGMLRLYRVTRNVPQPSEIPFIYQSARIRNPEELAKVKPALD
jgi:hypothetical protein